MRFVVLLLLLAVAVWLLKEFADARRREASMSDARARERLRLDRIRPGRRRQPAPESKPEPPPYQRVSDADLDQRVAALKDAVARGDVTREEAESSLVRWAGLTPARARDLLA